MNGEILYQGHASLRIKTKNGKVIYVDPFGGEGYNEPADLILVTHQHFDHNQIEKPKKNSNCKIIQNFDLLKNGKYLSQEFNGIKVTAVPAYNKSHSKDECIGFILNVDNKVIYVAGDTAKTEEMKNLKDLNIDYAFLPIDPTFTMTPTEAQECAEIIQAKQVIPYHMKPGGLFSQKRADQFKVENKLVLKPGDSIKY